MKRLCHCIMACLALVPAVSCDYRDLCTIAGETCSIRIDVDWSEFAGKETPTGMSVYCYPRGGSSGPYIYKTNDIAGVTVSLPVGIYDIMVFNQSVDEFGSMRFVGMDGYSTATAVLEDRITKWKVKTSSGDEPVKYEPEWLAVARKEGVEVTREMVERSWKTRPWTQGGSASKKESGEAVTLIELTPENVVYTVHIYIRVYGINNMSMGRGSISGMAGGVNLSTGSRTNSTVTHPIESWTVTRDGDDATRGYVSTSLRCFGLPDDAAEEAPSSGRAPEANIFNFTYLLVDGQTLDSSYEVGEKIECHDDILELDLRIGYDGNDEESPTTGGDPDRPVILPDVKHGGDSGFTADLEDWGDIEIIDIPV